jgi:hypothetical protein
MAGRSRHRGWPENKADTASENRLTDRSVANIVKAYAERAGLDPSWFSGHSLRSGAAAKGAKMMDRHKSVDTLRGYVRMPSCSRITRGRGCFDAARECSDSDLRLARFNL